MTTIGSTCSGYGGLDLAALALFPDARIAWHAEYNDDASRILEHHWPGVPNLRDLTAVDWNAVEPVDILVGGFPCQDVSTAGKRAGLRPGTRTGIWANIAYGISVIRPRLVLLENVGGLLSAGAHSDMEPCPWCVGDEGGEHVLRALGAVLGDLASLGYDACWARVSASDVGAPHGRARVFIAAAPADTERGGRDRHARTEGRGALGRTPAPRSRPRDDRGATSADASRDGRDEGRPEPARLVRGPHAPVSGHEFCPTCGDPVEDHDGGGFCAGRCGGTCNDPDLGRPTAPADTDLSSGEACGGRSGTRDARRLQPLVHRGANSQWGAYTPAITRWERVLGRPAPRPTEPGRNGRERLSPRFVEWLMGLPAGWVTDVPGLTRNAQLTALGNGVVPAQAEAAYRMLLPHLLDARVAA